MKQRNFLMKQTKKPEKKILYNVDRAKFTLDPKIFKKLTGDIWEFRAKYRSQEYRLFAFWDKRFGKNTLVIATHGLIKKTQKTPKSEIDKALKIRDYYFSKNK